MARRKRNRKSRAAQPAAGPPADAAVHTDRLRPWLLGAMCALFVARPLFPSEAAAYQGDGLPMVMLWIVLAVLWLLGAIGRPRFRVVFGWADAAVILLIAWHTIAAVWAATHLSPRPAVNMLWEWIALGLAFLLARQLIVGRRESRAVVAVMISLAVALSAHGLYQYFHELPDTRAQYAADPDGTLRAQGLWYPPGSRERELFESRLASSEPFATFALTNSLAGYLAPWLVMLAGVAAVATVGGDSSRRSNTRRTPVGDGSRLLQGWPAVALCAIPIAACLLLTKSRSGWVAAVLGLVLVWLLCRRRKTRLGWKLPAGVAALGAILVAAAVAGGGLDRQVLWEASKSLGYRVQYWQSTLRMIADHPFVGCGPGNFQHAYTTYMLPEASEEVADPHNFLLEVWATAGTPAMLALLAALGCFFNRPRSHALRGNEPPPAPAQSGVPMQSVGTRHAALPEGEETIDSPVHVFGGAACGFLLALPLGLICAAPPSVTGMLWGLPLGAACVGLLAGWVYQGRLPGVLPAIGVVVLLVNLLAAGGIGFPGVAGSLWLLMALGLNTARGDRPPPGMPRSVALLALVAAVALGMACYITGYGPVLRCQGHIRAARGEPSRAREHLQAAADADPLAAGPYRQLAAMAFELWRRDPSPGRFQQFQRYNAKGLKLTPNSSRAWLISGDWHLEAFSRTSGASDVEPAVRSGYVNEAVRSYSRAVELYPHSGLYRAKLALAHRAAGNQHAFRREADRALLLDEQTPHSDKKLRELRRQLLPGVGGP